MTDRDTFAAAALTGLIANEGEGPSLSATCRYAYRVADAMLRERGVTEPMPQETRAEVSYTLTDEEREAVEWAIYEGPLRSQAEGAEERANTLRKLLERLG